ncbi:F-box/FBD/LRR-repeat protein At4g00160-like [Gastrolobium bilobum]|uniref:F-box/FBD/LRR-repeat protein At4g00160-like n=1 Tax=Gastrolobium bilobum TaxID=150636 RepID=UPI002AB2E60A|nr:F-box/FBD/LRR-repeat protein At4g00160-like [Gastrolobium bilobum]
MENRINTLPDAVLCHILSFLPTREAITTSVLSKRWKPLWLSVPTLDFDDCRDIKNHEEYSRFVQLVYAVILSRELHQPIKEFFLTCWSYDCEDTNVNIWVTAALRRRIEYLELCLRSTISFPSSILSSRTLVVLNLIGSAVRSLSRVDFPALKILHFNFVRFLERRYLAEFLSGCPVLEDLETNGLYFSNNLLNVGECKSLSKLVRAYISKTHIPLEAVNNVESLRIDWLDDVNDKDMTPSIKFLIPEFYNLTHIELTYFYFNMNWVELVEVLKHCPLLQVLIINQNRDFVVESNGGDWPYPQSVPKSISLHLQTCRLNNYRGSNGEFRFARYIMQNARLLRTMTICLSKYANLREKMEMIKNLSMCTRGSETCELHVNETVTDGI